MREGRVGGNFGGFEAAIRHLWADLVRLVVEDGEGQSLTRRTDERVARPSTAGTDDKLFGSG